MMCEVININNDVLVVVVFFSTCLFILFDIVSLESVNFVLRLTNHVYIEAHE